MKWSMRRKDRYDTTGLEQDQFEPWVTQASTQEFAWNYEQGEDGPG